MNLIEQLGGYDIVKKAYTKLIQEQKDLITCGSVILVKTDIESLLLQYRREHNIYEVGDSVVMVSKRRSPKLWTWVHTTNWRPNHSLLKNDKENCLYPISDDEYCHATDEEIKANKRLD